MTLGAGFGGLAPDAMGALCAVAVAAGWVDAVAGGGGLLQLPALLVALPTAPPATLLGTNKLASIVGTTAAAVTYGRRIPPQPGLLVPMAIAAFVGSLAGASSATRLSPEVFRPLALALLCAVAVLVVARPQLGLEEQAGRGRAPRSARAGTVAGALAIGFYDGLFGPGTGTFLVLWGVLAAGASFLGASALAKALNVATNLAALVVFVPRGEVYWPLGLAMASCNLVGGWLGARTATTYGSGFVRRVYLGVVAALLVRLGWDVWR